MATRTEKDQAIAVLVEEIKATNVLYLADTSELTAEATSNLRRSCHKAGIRMIAEGSVTDDDTLNAMGDAALGVVTAHHYSASHNSTLNRQFVEAFGKANNGLRPNFMAVGGYDGMRVIYEAAKASKGADGEALLNAMKGQAFESPRGPVRIDPQTRDVVHNIYIRKVDKSGGQLWNQEIQTVADVKDPGKSR